jgi:hypothetical protein
MGIVLICHCYVCLCNTFESSRMACTEFKLILPAIAAQVSLHATEIQDQLVARTPIAEYLSDQHHFGCDVSWSLATVA